MFATILHSLRLAAIFLVALFLPVPRAAADPVADLLAKIKESQSLHQNIEVELSGIAEEMIIPKVGPKDDFLKSSKIYYYFAWQDGKHFEDFNYVDKSYREKETTLNTKILWDGSRQTYYRDAPNLRYATINDQKPIYNNYSTRFPCGFDGFSNLDIYMSTLHLPNGWSLVIKDGGQTSIQERPSQVLHLDYVNNKTGEATNRRTIYFDKERSFLPLRMEYYLIVNGESMLRETCELHDFKELSPSIWFAHQYSYRMFEIYGENKNSVVYHTTLTAIKVALIPTGEKTRIPKINFAEGTEVKVYKNDSKVNEYTVEIR